MIPIPASHNLRPGRPTPPHRGLKLHFRPRQSLATGRRTALAAVAHGGRARSGLLLAACREAVAWPRPWTVAVPMAPPRSAEQGLLAEVAEALEASGLDPERLALGFAESALLDADTDLLLTLSAIRDLGAAIDLDDFGSGVASLSLLRRLPLTGLKLDQALLRHVPAEPEDAALLQAIVRAGHAIGLTVIADGIETDRQRSFLSKSACDEGQGRLFE